MPKIDYSNDSFFKANQKVAKIALKNIQPPPVPITDLSTITQTVTNQPVAIKDIKQSATTSLSVSASSYTELLRLFNILSHDLDESLTDLDSMNENNFAYPEISMINKKNHNPAFDEFMSDKQKQHYRNQGETILLSKIPNIIHNAKSEHEYLDKAVKLIPNIWGMSEAEKRTMIGDVLIKYLTACENKIKELLRTKIAQNIQGQELFNVAYEQIVKTLPKYVPADEKRHFAQQAIDEAQRDDEYYEAEGLHRGGGPKKIVAVPKRSYKSVHKPGSLDNLSVKELRKLIDTRSFENDRGKKIYTSTALKPDLLEYLYNEEHISESHDEDYNYKVRADDTDKILKENNSGKPVSEENKNKLLSRLEIDNSKVDDYDFDKLVNEYESGSSKSGSVHSKPDVSKILKEIESSHDYYKDKFPLKHSKDDGYEEIEFGDDKSTMMSPVSSSHSSKDKKTDIYLLMTADLRIINVATSNLLLHFKGSIAPFFNTLNRRQVETINKENEALRPKFHELISDEFVNKYHLTQTNTITQNSNELYTVINNCVKSYVQPTINGAGFGNKFKPITMHKYYL